MRTAARLIPALALLGLVACEAPKPEEHLEVVEFETYWAVEAGAGDISYLAPVARVMIRNRRIEPSPGIQATATFRRVSEPDETWGSGWQQVARASSPLEGSATSDVVLKSDGRYYSTGPAEAFFEHELFRDATVEVFFRVGSSTWVKMAEGPIDRRIGRKGIVLPPP